MIGKLSLPIGFHAQLLSHPLEFLLGLLGIRLWSPVAWAAACNVDRVERHPPSFTVTVNARFD